MTVRHLVVLSTFATLSANMPALAQDQSDDIEEIQVTGRPATDNGSGSIASRILDREEIRRGVGTAGDIFRGLSALPGVAATGAFSSFTVRGSGPRDNLILIDGIPYDRAVHFDQTLGEAEDIGGGGRFSIFGQEVVGEATFKPGGWEAAYGGAGGALLHLDLAEGNTDTPTLSAKIDLAGGEVLYDGPSLVRDDTSLLVSARYYDFGQLFKLIGAEEIGRPVLSDFLLKTVTRLENGSTLKLLALYTPEDYTRDLNAVLADPELEDPLILNSRQKAGLTAATLLTPVGENGNWSNSIYYRWASDRSRQGEALYDPANLPSDLDLIPVEDTIIALQERESEAGWRSDYSADNRLGRFTAGLRLSRLSVDYNQSLMRDYVLLEFDQNDFRPDQDQNFIQLTPAAFDSSLDRSAVRAAGYLDQQFGLGAIDITAGIRLDHDALLSSTTASPRLQVAWQKSDRTRLNLTAGLFYQSPRLLDVAADPGNLALKPERIAQATLGFLHEPGQSWEMTGEVYYHQLSNLIPESDRVTGVKTNSGKGWAAGLDIALTRRFANHWSGSVRYGYNKTRVDDGDGRGYHPSQFNRPHLVNMTLFRELGRNWSMGVQYQIASGRPSDDYTVHQVGLPDSGLVRFSREITSRYTGRYQTWQSLNFRVDYEKQVGSVKWKVFMDVINVMGRKNIDAVDFSVITGQINTDGLGVFPQVGLSLQY